jgi:hypothetical protein
VNISVVSNNVFSSTLLRVLVSTCAIVYLAYSIAF